MAIELRGFDDLQNDMVNMAYALDQGPGVNRALKAGAVLERVSGGRAPAATA